MGTKHTVTNPRALHPCPRIEQSLICRFPLCSCSRISGVFKDERANIKVSP